MTLIAAVVSLTALSNIMCSMTMLVRHKAREIAILRTIGMSRSSVAKVFIAVGSIIGLLGEVAGLGIGLGLSAAKDPLAYALRDRIARPSIELDVLLSLPLSISVGQLTWIVMLISTGVLLSTLFPAVRAAAVDPASALKHT